MRVFCVRIARKHARVRIARKYARAPTARKTGFWGTKSGLNVPQTFEIRGVGAHSERKMPQRALFSVFGARFLTNLCPKVPKSNELGHASGYTCPNFPEKGILGYKNLQNVSQTRKIGGFGTQTKRNISHPVKFSRFGTHFRVNLYPKQPIFGDFGHAGKSRSNGLGHAGESPQIKRLPLTRQPTNILFFLQYLYRLKLRNSPAA